MTEEDITTFYAITGLGWGVGSTLVEAFETYQKIQRQNFPRLDDEALEEAWGYIWQVPFGTTGFYHSPSGLYWTLEGGDSELAAASQRVAHVGHVPESLRLTR